MFDLIDQELINWKLTTEKADKIIPMLYLIKPNLQRISKEYWESIDELIKKLKPYSNAWKNVKLF